MPHHYLLPCSCGQKVRVANAQAGGQVTCRCGKSLSVPTLRGLRELEFAPPELQRALGPGWSPIHGAIFAVGLLAGAAGLALVTYSLWRYTLLVHSDLASDRSRDVVQFESASIDKLTAPQMLGAWTELIDEGLGEKRTPIWVAAREKIAQYKRWMALGGGTIALGLLLSLATLYIGRPNAAN